MASAETKHTSWCGYWRCADRHDSCCNCANTPSAANQAPIPPDLAADHALLLRAMWTERLERCRWPDANCLWDAATNKHHAVTALDAHGCPVLSPELRAALEEVLG